MRDLQLPGRSPVWAEHGVCATSSPIAAEAAVQMLKDGGNALDAAIAGAVLLGVTEPHMCGLGGDCFALISPAGTDDIHAFNGSGRAVAKADPQVLRDQGHATVPLTDPLAVTVPGAVDGFFRMNALWGRKGMDEVLAPAIRYFDQGVAMASRVTADYAQLADKMTDTARRHFLPWGRAPKPGDRLAMPGQAEVLRRLAKDGAKAFYEGEVAEDIIDALKKLGGPHELDDLAQHAGMQTDPIHGDYHGTELWEHPPNGQGATAILLANMLAQFDIAAMDPRGAERAHIEAEATRLAYDARNRFVADPDHMTQLDYMLDLDTARKLAALIDRKKATATLIQGAEAVHKDTVYITVVDRDRMSVSLIYSVFHGFGSGICSDKFGIMLQNRGAGFSLTPGHENEMAPGKRPMHTIIPGMLKQGGKVIMPFGVMGGAYQATGHARFLSNIVDFGMDPQEAMDCPRLFAEGDTLTVERGYAPEVRQALADMGHKVEDPGTPIGGSQAIRIHDNGFLEAGSDHRKDGCAIGY
ncbi:gamma-glutamyltransferase [Pseudooceanicola onchidii]|uniref:gamma-glutamyltransferase n=1 Tax=Pseudooceanicola onchidii TaxID=2562279 RepID=UPI0010AA9AD8|nr:gamma-glutamyltransferase [Pseudooceanicola onchidii]